MDFMLLKEKSQQTILTTASRPIAWRVLAIYDRISLISVDFDLLLLNLNNLTKINTPEGGKMFFTILKYLFIATNISLLAISAYVDRTWTLRYKKINWKIIPLNILVLFIVLFSTYFLLTNYPEVMGFGLARILQLIFKESADQIPAININLIGVDIKYVGIVICLLLMTALPHAAEVEEKWFRLGTKNWKDGILKSLLFGLFHLIAFVPLGAALSLSLAGLFFTFLYFKGGTELSSQGHFQHNLILVTILLVFTIINTFS